MGVLKRFKGGSKGGSKWVERVKRKVFTKV